MSNKNMTNFFFSDTQSVIPEIGSALVGQAMTETNSDMATTITTHSSLSISAEGRIRRGSHSNRAMDSSSIASSDSDTMLNEAKSTTTANNITKKEYAAQLQQALSSAYGSTTSPEVSSAAASDHVFYLASCCAIVVWLSLLLLVYLISDKSEWVYLPEEERNVALLAVILQTAAFLLQMMKIGLNLFSSDRQSSVCTVASSSSKNNLPVTSSSNLFFGSPGSGILVAGVTVLFVSFCTNCLLAFAPTVVKIDPVTRSRVFLIRWCEWIPLAGFMTFLSEGLEVSGDSNNNQQRSSNKTILKNCGKNEKNEKNTDSISLKTVVIWSLSQTASCVPGFAFPFCNNMIAWNLVMLFAMITYFCIFVRVSVRRRLYHETLSSYMVLLEETATQNGKSAQALPPPLAFSASNRLVLEKERIQRQRFSYYLLLTCAVVWTFLVGMYFFNMFFHLNPEYAPAFVSPSLLAMAVDTIFDIIAKVFYMALIIGVYLDVFDPSGRVQRQLTELRRLVSAIWESSSDTIVISVRIQLDNTNHVVSMLSPSFTTLLGIDELQISKPPGNAISKVLPRAALMLEMEIPEVDIGCDDDVLPSLTISSAYYVDAASIAIGEMPNANETIIVVEDLDEHAVVEASRIIVRTWEDLLDISHLSDSDAQNNNTKAETKACSEDHIIPPLPSVANWSLKDHPVVNLAGTKLTCELKVSKHAEDAVVAVVRDVTERDRRFESERRAHAETLARQRDAQAANRFTRHEVKNGLLAGIELCDSMRNSFNNLKISLTKEMEDAMSKAMSDDEPLSSSTENATPFDETATDKVFKTLTELCEVLPQRLDELLQDGIARHISDLDETLQEVLETTLTEAMSREVVHEVYVPRLERVSIASILETSGIVKRKARFPVNVIHKESMPDLLLDVQLLNYIHRNAISNACKYGEPGGIVSTKAWYDNKDKILQLQVSNQPGPCHQELLDMGEAATVAVFQQGVQLQNNSKQDRPEVDCRTSSGDGAWIMQKCAMTMGGTCSIEFLPTETVFTFLCPALPAVQDENPNFHEFRVPSNTWGVAVEDSKIQRKLIDRIFANVGVEETNRIMLGEKSSDIEDLEQIVTGLLDKEEDANILIMMDENLDYVGTDSVPILISGSVAGKMLLNSLTKEQQARVLMLIRSANDSAEEISWYLDRSHGFFPKATMQRDRVREILAPLWIHRFNNKIAN